MKSPSTWRPHHWALARARPFYWREAALCVPAIPLLLTAGLLTGHAAYGAVAAGAAFSVGFGAARDLRGRRWAAMGAAAAGMTIAAFVGSFIGQWPVPFIAVAACAAAACAALALLDEDLWWVSMQIVIALLVAGYYAGPPGQALIRAGYVLAGGLTQMAVVMVLARLVPRAAARLPAGPPKDPPDQALMVGHVARAAVCVALGLTAAHALGLANSYWAPMTAMLVLKPGLHETQARGLARLAGTVGGCVAASLFAIGVGYDEPLLVAGVALTGGAAFALQKAHYGMLTSAVTATVVLLLSLGHHGVLLNAEHRLIASLLGGVIALVVARIAPHSPRVPPAVAEEDRVGADRPPDVAVDLAAGRQ